MAITYLAAGAIGNSGAGVDLTLALPAPGGGILADDFLVACPINNTSTVWATTAFTAAGFTRRNVQQSGTGAQSPTCAIFYKKATGGETGNIVGTSPGGTSQGMAFAFRGVDTTTPFDVTDVQNAWGAVAAYDVPTQDPTMDGVAQLILGVANSATGSFTPPTNPASFTEIADNVIASTPHLWLGYLLGQADAATGTRNLIRSGAIRGGSIGVMLRPAAAVAAAQPLIYNQQAIRRAANW